MGAPVDEQTDPRFLVGQVLAGRYWLQEHLGRGAMGDVFRARHAKVPRTFAVKVLHPELVEDPKICRRFEREAELAGRLHHRNVVSVLDVGETARSRYLVMEYAEGVSLLDVIAGRPLATSRVIQLAKQICDGLQHAHELELVHRDLKPENIIVERTGTDEVVRIVDFGLAILRDDASPANLERLTTRGIVLGTPHYLAPEMALGKDIDHRIDLFALGVVLFEMMTGVMPFDGDGVAVVQHNLHSPTPMMAVRAPGVAVDPLLEALVGKLLEKKPGDRPQSAREVRSLLDLVENDRARAGFLLGVKTLPATQPLPVALRAPRLDVKVGAAPTREAQRAHHGDVDGEREVVTDHVHTTAEVSGASRSRRRGAAIALGVIGLIAAIVVVVARRDVQRDASSVVAAGTASESLGPRSTDGRAHEQTAHEPSAHEPSTPVATQVPDGSQTLPPEGARPIAATESAPSAARAQAAADDATPVATTRSRPARGAPTTVRASAEPDEPPPRAADVLALYQSLGRELKGIADRRDMAADDLWIRYRRVRIQDVMASAAKRTEALAILTAIDREIGKRFRGAL